MRPVIRRSARAHLQPPLHSVHKLLSDQLRCLAFKRRALTRDVVVRPTLASAQFARVEPILDCHNSFCASPPCG